MLLYEKIVFEWSKRILTPKPIVIQARPANTLNPKIPLNPKISAQFELKSQCTADTPPPQGGGITLMSMDWILGFKPRFQEILGI